MSIEPKRGRPVEAKVTFESPKELPLLYAHQAIVNFTGNEFYVTVYATAPEPWATGQEPNLNVEGRALARFAFAPINWLAFVESVYDQSKSLEEQGAFPPGFRDAARGLIAK